MNSLNAVTLDDLLKAKTETPAALARHFANFKFELCNRLQSPDTFLQRERGDCADYANLASLVLTQHGYTTKLVVVMMSKQTHVVCYVKEAAGFLDYNHRADACPIVKSSDALEEIADRVSTDFRSDWHIASKFRYQGDSPVFLESTFPIDQSLARTSSHKPAKDRPTSASAMQGPSSSRAALPSMEATITAPLFR